MIRRIVVLVLGILLWTTLAFGADPYRSDHVLGKCFELIERAEQAQAIWHQTCHEEAAYCRLVGIPHTTCQLIAWDDTSTSNENGECETKPLPAALVTQMDIVKCLAGLGGCTGSWGFLAAVIANDQLTEPIETQALAVLAETEEDIEALITGYEGFRTCSMHKTDCALTPNPVYCNGWPKQCSTTGPAQPFPTTTTTTTAGSTTTTTTFPGLAKFNIGFNVIGSRLSGNVCGLRFHPNKSELIYPVGCTGWQSENSVVTVGTDIPATTITGVCASRVDNNDASIKTGQLEETTHALRVNGQVVASTIIEGASSTECASHGDCGVGGICGPGGECTQKCIDVSVPLASGDTLQAGRDMIPFGCALTCNPTSGNCENGTQWCGGVVYGSTVEVFDD